MKPLRLLFALALLPLASGFVVVTYHDAIMTHYPVRAALAEQVRSGTFPFLNPAASCAQPLAGNPNFGTFFPETLLLLLLPLPVAFGLRFALPLALGLLGARRWARAEGVARQPAEVAGFAFVLSGVFVSTWRFYNSGLALALAPWTMAAVGKLVRRSAADDGRGMRRAAAEMGLWAGLEVLAGEPVVALLTFTLAGARAAVGLRQAKGAAALLTGFLLAALLAAPQAAATAQILPDSSRERKPFPFVVATGTSVQPLRLAEQVVPFPFGRPDLRGPDGFDAHALFGYHPPYLWTLHVGLVVLGLLVLFGRPAAREERAFWVIAAGAVLLALGRFLPGAKALYPFLSLGGRIRFPVKWWYVVALCLIPLVGWAAGRWHEGVRPGRFRLALGLCLLLASVVALGALWPHTALGAFGPLLSIAALAALVSTASRPGPRPAGGLATAIALTLLVCDLPLLLAFLDRSPPPPPRVALGRIFARVRVAAHPFPPEATPAETSVRDYYRRANAELWPLTAAEVGGGYAFDDDPDGAYSDDDRALRKAVEARPWAERAAELRLAGVVSLVVDEALPSPYREAKVLNAREGVRLYALEPAVPTVRFATRVRRVSTLDELLAEHRRPGFDPATDAVLMAGPSSVEGLPLPVRPATVREGVDHLVAEVETPAPGLLVWSRTFFSAWRATVDGVRVSPLRAEGHLVGVPVPAGAHRVEIVWSRTPVAWGFGLLALGLTATALLRRA